MAGIPAAVLVPPHIHPQGQSLINDINAAALVAGFNSYDILRLPLYKTHNEHIENHQAIQDEIADPTNPCTCAGQAAAVALINAHWPNINTPAAKVGYDAGILAAPVPVIPIPTFIPPADLRQKVLRLGRWRTWDREFDSVQGCQPGALQRGNRKDIPKTLVWTKFKLPKFCLRRASTFWTSLAIALFDYTDPESSQAWQFWADVKWATNEYYRNVMAPAAAGAAHPRKDEYTALNAYSIAKGNGSFTNQLRAGSAAPAVVLPRDASPELWQVVADAWHIELLVISGDNRDGLQGRIAVIPRGDHNQKQIFLRREPDGEYHAVKPDKPDSFNWRYDFHMVRDLLQPPTQQRMLDAFNEEIIIEGIRRCPYVLTDADGVAISPVVNIANYNGGFDAPMAVQDEAMYIAPPTAAQLAAYLNNGLAL